MGTTEIKRTSLIPKPCSIVDSISPDQLDKFQFYTKRYYEYKYRVNFPRVGNFDTLLKIHSNRAVMLSLATGHDIVQHKYPIKEVIFQINEKTNRSNLKLSGKMKRGAQSLEPTSIVCYLKCDNNIMYPVYSGIYGRLIEVNENIVLNPNLLVEHRQELGYICIILPNLYKLERTLSDLLTEEQYLQYLNNKDDKD